MSTILKEVKKHKNMPKGSSKNQANPIKEAASTRTKNKTIACAKPTVSLTKATAAINDFSCHSDLDTQRIKDAFFSPAKDTNPLKNKADQTARETTQTAPAETIPSTINEALAAPEVKTEIIIPQKSAHPKKIKRFSFLTLIFIAAIALFIGDSLNSRYEFLVVNRNHIPLARDEMSLFSSGTVSYITLLAKNSSETIKPESFSISSGINEAQINFTRPLDLRNSSLALLINKPDGAIDMKVVVRDNKFFSNALSPITIKLDQNSSSLIKASLDLSAIASPYVNPAKITQVRVYFQTPDKKATVKVLIKDLVLIQKGLRD